MKDLLHRHNFRFSKSLGQNFLCDKNLLAAIVRDAKVGKNDIVVEIGAGAGTLTAVLSMCAKSVDAYEIDRALEPVLRETLAACGNVRLHFADVLKIPTETLESEVGGAYRVVANLPYYITTPLIFKFIEEAQNAVSLTFLVQKEVAERLVAAPGRPEYGAASVAVQAAGSIKICRTVPRSMFTPPPNVDSAVVHIELDAGLFNIKCREIFRKTVKAAFAMRRKTLVNNLCAAFDLSREAAETLVLGVCENKNIRGEALSVPQFVELSEGVRKFIAPF